LCWTLSSLFFEQASHRIGSMAVNLIRLVMAFALFAVTLIVFRGAPIPFDFPAHAWIWLTVSGVIGFALGDLCLFRAFVEIGPRLSMLVMCLVPPMTAVMGWSVLNEEYSTTQWIGMGITVAGVIWVVLERSGSGNGERQTTSAGAKSAVLGVACAFGGAVGQAVGAVLGKHGMGDLEPFAATQIRVIAGIVGIALIYTFLRAWPTVWHSVSERRTMVFTAAGALFGPYLGVALLMLAFQYTSTGVASTIVAMVPLTLIPIDVLFRKQGVSCRACVGTIIAIAGVIMLVR
jgi:drug/metabolite transporter (DMT)-like permease